MSPITRRWQKDLDQMETEPMSIDAIIDRNRKKAGLPPLVPCKGGCFRRVEGGYCSTCALFEHETGKNSAEQAIEAAERAS